MKLHEKKKIVAKSSKRVGRGYGSGKGGHNSTRGTKGQKARNSVPAYFVGSSWVWFKRLPFMRGKSKFGSIVPTRTITLSELNKLKPGTVVTPASLFEAGIISRKESTSAKIKVVGTGSLTTQVVLKVAATQAAVQAVLKAGGEHSAQNS